MQKKIDDKETREKEKEKEKAMKKVQHNNRLQWQP